MLPKLGFSLEMEYDRPLTQVIALLQNAGFSAVSPLWGQDLAAISACVQALDMTVQSLHAPPKGIGDLDDPAHQGFEAFLELMEKYHPKYLLHGHVHLRYGTDQTRVRQYGDTQVINVCERYVLELPDLAVDPQKLGKIKYYTRRRPEDV